MTEKKSLSKDFMDNMPFALRKASKQKQIAFLLMTFEKYPDQYQEFVESFGMENYLKIMPKA